MVITDTLTKTALYWLFKTDTGSIIEVSVKKFPEHFQARIRAMEKLGI